MIMIIRDTEDRQYSGQHSIWERTKSHSNFPQNTTQITKECTRQWATKDKQKKTWVNLYLDQSFVCVPLLVLLSDRPTVIHVDNINSSLCTYKKMHVSIIICMCSIYLWWYQHSWPDRKILKLFWLLYTGLIN